MNTRPLKWVKKKKKMTVGSTSSRITPFPTINNHSRPLPTNNATFPFIRRPGISLLPPRHDPRFRILRWRYRMTCRWRWQERPTRRRRRSRRRRRGVGFLLFLASETGYGGGRTDSERVGGLWAGRGGVGWLGWGGWITWVLTVCVGG